jgi:hypothetical protein
MNENQADKLIDRLDWIKTCIEELNASVRENSTIMSGVKKQLLDISTNTEQLAEIRNILESNNQ